MKSKQTLIIVSAVVVLGIAAVTIAIQNRQTPSEPTGSTDSTSQASETQNRRNRASAASTSSRDALPPARKIKTVAEAKEISDPTERGIALLTHLSSLSPKQLLDELDSLEGKYDEDSVSVTKSICRLLGSKAAERVVELAKQKQLPKSFQARAFLDSWAIADVDALAQCYKENEDLFLTEGTYVLREGSPSGTSVATPVGKGPFYLGGKTSIASTITQGIARNSPAKALAWANSNFDAGKFSIMLGQKTPLEIAVEALFQEDPQQAAQSIHNLPNGHNRNFAYGTLAKTWAKKDPQAALRWVETTPENVRESLKKVINQR